MRAILNVDTRHEAVQIRLYRKYPGHFVVLAYIP